MTPAIRKFSLTLHLAVSLGWIGAVVAYLALAVAAATSQDGQTVRASWIAMELTGWLVLVPLAIAALLTGLVMSLGTPWGLLRHYWVIISLVLTVASTVILILHMPSVSSLADRARESDGKQLGLASEFLHAGGGLLVLLVIAALNVYKPRGMTPYGRRRQQDERLLLDARAPTRSRSSEPDRP